jgi:hypothetical protein
MWSQRACSGLSKISVLLVPTAWFVLNSTQTPVQFTPAPPASPCPAIPLTIKAPHSPFFDYNFASKAYNEGKRRVNNASCCQPCCQIPPLGQNRSLVSVNGARQNLMQLHKTNRLVGTRKIVENRRAPDQARSRWSVARTSLVVGIGLLIPTTSTSRNKS